MHYVNAKAFGSLIANTFTGHIYMGVGQWGRNGLGTLFSWAELLNTSTYM